MFFDNFSHFDNFGDLGDFGNFGHLALLTFCALQLYNLIYVKSKKFKLVRHSGEHLKQKPYFVFPAVSICTLYKADLIKIILSRFAWPPSVLNIGFSYS